MNIEMERDRPVGTHLATEEDRAGEKGSIFGSTLSLSREGSGERVRGTARSLRLERKEIVSMPSPPPPSVSSSSSSSSFFTCYVYETKWLQ